jgi:hypothetical protein
MGGKPIMSKPNFIGVQFEQDVWVTENVKLDTPMPGMRTIEQHVTPEGKPVVKTHEDRLVKRHSDGEYRVLHEVAVKDMKEKGVRFREIVTVSYDQLNTDEVRVVALVPGREVDHKAVIDFLVEKQLRAGSPDDKVG